MLLPDVPTPDVVLDDPAASFWLKDALRAALERDPVDATNDAMLLANVLDARAAIAVMDPSTIVGDRMVLVADLSRELER